MVNVCVTIYNYFDARVFVDSLRVGVSESESGHFWGFRSRSRSFQKLADSNSDSSKTLYCFFIKTIAGKVWFSSISRKFATEKEFIFNGKDAVCITRLKEIQTSKISLMIHLVGMTCKFDLYMDGKRKYKNICY